MATPTIVVLVCVAVATVLALVALVVVVVRHLASLAADVGELEQRLGPSLEQLRSDADLTSREVARVSEALDELARSRGRQR